MPSEDYMSDDYVAKIMTKDAKESTVKYSTMGLQGPLPKRPTTSAPRANTRFLKNIIRETDTHNAALRAKELEEARLRLKRLRHHDSSTNLRLEKRPSHGGSVEKSHERSRKRRRLDSDEEEDQRRLEEHKKLSSNKSRKRPHKGRDDHRHRLRDNRSDEDLTDEKGSSRHRTSHRSRRHRSRTPDENTLTRRSRSTKFTQQRRSRSPIPEKDEKHHRSRRRRRQSSSPATERIRDLNDPAPRDKIKSLASTQPVRVEDADSDPLEAIVGPAPPPPAPKVRARGRGTFASSSVMDSHFSSAYDPAADVHPNSDSENDWDQALEALRDRQRWKQQGAERLRSAGFTEEEVSKWEKGGEKREEDVKWKERGEGREWDRGKVVDEDGVIDTRPEWGRLKGT
ncbi:MAG: hypothetical protein Q9187_005881 [Circinaria calcarea]